MDRSGPAVSDCPGQTRPPPPLLARPLVLTQPLSLVSFLDILNVGFLIKRPWLSGNFSLPLGEHGALPVLTVEDTPHCIFLGKSLLSSSVWLGLEEHKHFVCFLNMNYKDVLTQDI